MFYICSMIFIRYAYEFLGDDYEKRGNWPEVIKLLNETARFKRITRIKNVYGRTTSVIVWSNNCTRKIREKMREGGKMSDLGFNAGIVLRQGWELW